MANYKQYFRKIIRLYYTNSAILRTVMVIDGERGL